MRKLLILLFVSIAISCSPDDEEELIYDVTGSWRLEKIVVGDNEYMADDCMQQMTYTLLENKSVNHNKILFLTPADPDAECISADEQYEYFTWRNVSGNSFEFEYKIEGEDPWKMPFTIEGNKMVVRPNENQSEYYIRN